MSVARDDVAGTDPAWDRESTLCIIEFGPLSGASDSESTATVEGPGNLLGLCGARPRSAREDLPKELLDLARETAVLDGRAEWIMCAWPEGADAESSTSLMAAVLLHANDPAALSELIRAAEELRPSFDCLDGDDVQVRLLSSEPHGIGTRERFEQCSRLFTASGAADVKAASFKRLPVNAALSLFQCGYCVVDDFLDAAQSAGVVEALRPSMEAWLETVDPESGAKEGCSSFGAGTSLQHFVGQTLGLETDLQWKKPQPWRSRGDYIAGLHASDRLAHREPMQSVMLALQDILDDLRAFIDLRGQAWGDQEVQLAWYPGGSIGYRRHFDAPPDGGSSMAGRRVTAIVYCNSAWLSEHGGELQLWPPLKNQRVDVEPLAGRLLVFLSGCVPHAVRPAQRDRVAVTMWAR
mmetsp:Transcript_41781/g.121078  ORF Transcript_41781/g.121078 Transcript_41781/m.121078 type:complete len:409 (-) Transcript_41781:172-1398(-)